MLAQPLARRILAASIAAILLLPSLAAWGMDRMPGKPVPADAFEKKIALPPIPHLESMPWMKWNAGVNTKVDSLMPADTPSSFMLAPRERPAPSFGS
ncbi:hypothetical protein IVB14_06840 [Bradyrhizobium sp. 180]|uniref:hypothetical protein n=1 Tax=unclassified Bradyrhizobium TaxID=2631580 RepID=UPI001FFB90F5|nr:MULTISPECIES: hypothetical protein [unclassified Bradyrhizobium]MCK1425081.1 hypothetical protein [Bradyrhizobium sp. CW12]MCK1490150.1 hypothetical protein [Bradyrhizobium sp. 180]MCK1529917.1 hypothetical protein [Bradyrhizobium sp. 182]MCK1597607.1 hypothetical protein [Bradyrhizobium sp. 164]MCK1615566.1 hypothetical protein [Bradyrhizobium sp. 159]